DAQHNGIAGGAAGHGLRGKGTLEDHGKGVGHVGDAEDNNGDAGQDVETGHKGHHIAGHLADPLDAADNHDGHDDGQHDAHQQVGDLHVQGAQKAVDSAGDLRGLGDVADAETGDAAQNGKDGGQPLHMQALLNVVHGAAVVGAVGGG